MIARLQAPLTDLGKATSSPHGAGSAAPALATRDAWFAGALGFFCFMPYAAIPVGNSSAVQLGSLIALLIAVPALVARKLRGPLWIAPILLVPLIVSAIKVAACDVDLESCVKTLPPWAITLITITAIQICAPRYALELLTGIAIATVLHVVVGAWQFYCFSHDEFPLQWLYANQSFLSVQDYADVIAKYTQRPFGIFPEPSAMSSSLAPWVLFWIAEMCGIVRLRRAPRQWQRLLFAVAAIGALALIILSRSGHAAATTGAAIVLVVIWFSRCRASRGTYAAIVAVFGVLMPVTLYFAASVLADRLGGQSEMGNSSWEDRTNSLVIGFHQWMNDDLATVIFGLGSGQSAALLARTARLGAVWSVLLDYIYETGVVGALALCWIGMHLAGLWKAMRFNSAFAMFLLVWLVGITVTTSYHHLLTLWVALGWLSVWPAICESAPQLRLGEQARTRSLSKESNGARVPLPGEMLNLLPKTSRRLPRPANGALTGWRTDPTGASPIADIKPKPPFPAPRNKRWTDQ